MRININPAYKLIFLFLILLVSSTAIAKTEFTLAVSGEEFTLYRYPANGQQLVLYVAPSHGFNKRGFEFSEALSQQGIEVWMVDLAENLFLPHSSNAIRSINGQYLASIIQQAHTQSGKKITLLSSSYGAIPVLRGARQWQLNNSKLQIAYLNGAILFSPELYRGVPALGVDPEFVPISFATNIPVMIYQSELRNNRWQLESVLRNLERGDAVAYRKILPGITSYFYQLDTAPTTLKALRQVPEEIPRIIALLESTPTPLVAKALVANTTNKHTGMDSKLKRYKGNTTPLALDLVNIQGERIVRKNYGNKVTLVNFWASWCPPCVEEIPSLNRLGSKMSGKNFELISVNYAEEKATIKEFLKKVNVEFPVLLDVKGRTSADWNTIALPSTFVIGPDGKIAYGVNAAIQWDSPEVIAELKKLSQK